MERVGGRSTINVDVRVLAATNKDLKSEIEKKNFREDLYYRLNVVHIHMPPLREMKEDIPLLAQYFLSSFASELGRGSMHFSSRAMDTLLGYGWPGNVRELENTIKRVIVLSSDITITSDILLDAAPYLKDIIIEDKHSFEELIRAELLNLIDLTKEASPNGIYNMVIRKVEKPLIEEILRITKGNKKKAAAILGINRNTLSKKMEELGIYGEDYD